MSDTKLRVQVREETLREVATWCAERTKAEAFGLWLRGRESAFLDVMNHCLSLEAETVAASRRPAPTEDDGFTTVRADGRWWAEAAWPSVDGGLDG